MATEKYTIELTRAAREHLMTALVDLRRSNAEEITRAIAKGEMGHLDSLIARDQDLQHLFTLTLYAEKVGESEQNILIRADTAKEYRRINDAE